MIDDVVSSALERPGMCLAEHPVESRVPTSLPPVHVDGALLLQVFTNLLENVVKHTPSGTHATIEAVLDDQFVRISIEDTGLGLPPSYVEQLFWQIPSRPR
jgi:two-component system, OmpR family, sensor histidine kinase KdpD